MECHKISGCVWEVDYHDDLPFPHAQVTDVNFFQNAQCHNMFEVR